MCSFHGAMYVKVYKFPLTCDSVLCGSHIVCWTDIIGGAHIIDEHTSWHIVCSGAFTCISGSKHTLWLIKLMSTNVSVAACGYFAVNHAIYTQLLLPLRLMLASIVWASVWIQNVDQAPVDVAKGLLFVCYYIVLFKKKFLISIKPHWLSYVFVPQFLGNV